MPTTDDKGTELTARELAIAERAAELAAKKVEEAFYAQVGRGVVGKVLVWLFGGGLLVAWAKGWIVFNAPK